MNKNITRKVLIGAIISFTVLILFFSFQLLRSESTNSTGPQRIKAQGVTYTKILVINQMGNNLSPTNIPSIPSITPTPTEFILAYQNPSPTLTPTLIPTYGPSATQAVTPTGQVPTTFSSSLSATLSQTSSITVSPTIVKRLPSTGYVNNVLILFALASVLIFIAFIF